MFPGLGGMNPKQMQQLMKQMGIKSDQVPASKVTIHKKDGSTIVIEDPSVIAIDMKGDKSFQISGKVVEGGGEGEAPADGEMEEVEVEEAGAYTEKDVDLVAEQAKTSKDKAKAALEESNGDIAEAIMKLQGG